MIWIPDHFLREWLDDVNTWSVARRSDDVDTWPESQRDELDDLDTYLAADLFFYMGLELRGCVRVYRPLKREKLDNKERCRNKMDPDAR